jgi:uncharacterized membrane protein YhaH (DUF805 family)
MYYLRQLFIGRIGRLAYLFGTLYYFLTIFIPFSILLYVYGVVIYAVKHHPARGRELDPLYAMTLVLYICLIIASLSVTARRLNDVDRPAWFCIFSLVPFVDIPLGLYLLVAPGTDGVNNSGHPLRTYGFWEVTKFNLLRKKYRNQRKH